MTFAAASSKSDVVAPCDDTALCARIFWAFVAVHVVVWTLLPALTQPNAPLDVVEIVYWGHEWELGYYKHPPLPSWLSEGARVISGGSTWAIYLCAQLSVVTAFWAVWRLARELLSPRVALLAVLVLEGCCYYNFTTPEFNHAVCMLPFWALASLFFYWSLVDGRRRWWIATGVCLGLGLLSKYNTATLIAAMLALMAYNADARRHWRTTGPYLTMISAMVVFAPHLYWALDGGLTGVTYVLDRTRIEPRWYTRITYPLVFLLSQVGVLLPVAAAALPLVGWRWRRETVGRERRFARDFLWFLCLGPIVCYLLIGAIADLKLRSAYGSQLWLLAGIWLLFSVKLNEQAVAWRRSLAACAAVGSLMVFAALAHNFVSPYAKGKPSRIHFPGQALAADVAARWRERFDRPLPIAAGEWWLAGNVSYYDPERPSVYCGGFHPDSLDLISRYSEWTNDDDLARRGGVILWNAAVHGNELPATLRERFPQAETEAPLTLPWQTHAPLDPLQIGLAIVPPRDQREQTAAAQSGRRTR